MRSIMRCFGITNGHLPYFSPIFSPFFFFIIITIRSYSLSLPLQKEVPSKAMICVRRWVVWVRSFTRHLPQVGFE